MFQGWFLNSANPRSSSTAYHIDSLEESPAPPSRKNKNKKPHRFPGGLGAEQSAARGTRNTRDMHAEPSAVSMFFCFSEGGETPGFLRLKTSSGPGDEKTPPCSPVHTFSCALVLEPQLSISEGLSYEGLECCFSVEPLQRLTQTIHVSPIGARWISGVFLGRHTIPY